MRKNLNERILTGAPSRRDVLLAGAAITFPMLLLPRRASGAVVVRNPLFVPAVLKATSATLTCAVTTVGFGGGRQGSAWTYNGSLPGPSLVAWKGETANIRLRNQLNEITVTHWHGLHVDEENDGGPFFHVMVGDFKDYSFPVANRAGLSFYHPHIDGLTGKQVNLGLAGAFIVRDAEEAALGLPGSVAVESKGQNELAALPAVRSLEVPLVFRDATFDAAGNLSYSAQSSGFVGQVDLVNGTIDPYLDVARAVYRFRILNGSNAKLYRFALGNGQPFVLIGNDGGLLEFSVQIAEAEIGPGERLDVLVDLRNVPIGGAVFLRDLNSGRDLVEFRVNQIAPNAGRIPTGRLSTIPQLTNPLRTRTFSFDGMNRINGQRFDPNRIDFTVPFGDVEDWVFTTRGNGPHPVHVHGASFQVVSRTGGRNQTYPWEAGWKDTVLLNDQETVRVRIRFDRQAHFGASERYVIHCHQLEHEDGGMMSAFRVV